MQRILDGALPCLLLLRVNLIGRWAGRFTGAALSCLMRLLEGVAHQHSCSGLAFRVLRWLQRLGEYLPHVHGLPPTARQSRSLLP